MDTFVYLWENFGPMHDDRVGAVARHFQGQVRCIGIEQLSKSETYDWDTETKVPFEKITLFRSQRPSSARMLFALIRKELQIGRAVWFLCNHEQLHVVLFSFYLRFRFRKVYLMGCSKFDDTRRSLHREVIKFLILTPYLGIISSGVRSKDYFRFLGLRTVVGQYNSLSTERIKMLSGGQVAPNGAAFGDRDFLIVARLVEKKNLSLALNAFSIFLQNGNPTRRLVICGSGNLYPELEKLAADLGIGAHVVFNDFVQTAGIAQLMATSLALILPSIEEQFGNVVIEAQAMGLPVLLSKVCGARDILVRSWVNGFVFEPDNAEGLAYFMGVLSNDQALWEKMCKRASSSSALGDAARFVEGVAVLAAGNIGTNR